MHNDENHIRTLVERFMQADTTLEEEQQLYAYFGSEQMPADLLPLRDMMLGLGAMPTLQGQLPAAARRPQPAPTTATPAPAAPARHTLWSLRRHSQWGSVAASIALLTTFGLAMHRMPTDVCEAYIYSERVTNEQEVMRQVELTLHAVDSNMPTQAVDQQLRDVLLPF